MVENTRKIKGMTRKRKENLLYKMAKGQPCDATLEELQELRKYKVDSEWDEKLATHDTISKYISAVDNGYRLSFYDWCKNNLQGDRRRTSGKVDYIASENKSESMAAVSLGWLLWGLAVYWGAKEQMSVGSCAVAGAIISYILQKCFRKQAFFTLFILPCILAVLFATEFK